MEALKWILQNNYQFRWLIHYLDDDLIIAPPDSPECHILLAKFLQVCKLLGFPVAAEKVDGPATSIVFLGLELDSDLHQIRLPAEKLQDILKVLSDWQRHYQG